MLIKRFPEDGYTGYGNVVTGVKLLVTGYADVWRITVSSSSGATSSDVTYPTKSDAIVALDKLAATLGIYSL